MLTALYTALALPIVIFALWHLTTLLTPPPPPAILSGKRIILLIAHPDDESMFFSPTLTALTAPHLNNHLKILCLSTGNAAGLGDTRRKELEAAALTLGVRRREDVFVLNDETRFPDSMTAKWSEAEIAKVLASAFAPQLNTPIASTPPTTTASHTRQKSKSQTDSRSKKSKSSSKSSSATPSPPQTPSPSGPRATIDVLLTFDSTGISSHPNHIALYHGARLFLRTLMRPHPGHSCPVSLYTLTSVNLVRKYTFILDAIPTYIHGIISSITSSSRTRKPRLGDKLLFVSDFAKYRKARDAMVQGHQSQMVWFRWGWISIGRYMVVNDLRREHIAGT